MRGASRPGLNGVPLIEIGIGLLSLRLSQPFGDAVDDTKTKGSPTQPADQDDPGDGADDNHSTLHQKVGSATKVASARVPWTSSRLM